MSLQNYFEAKKAMAALFSKDVQFAFATSLNNEPSVRYVDAFYDDGCFYIVTYDLSRKCQAIKKNPQVSLCHRRMYAFSGQAINLGHPLKEENKAVREKLMKAFEPWYFKHNDEADEHMCYLKIVLSNGFVYQNGIGYRIDFHKKTAIAFPFTFDITLRED